MSSIIQLNKIKSLYTTILESTREIMQYDKDDLSLTVSEKKILQKLKHINTKLEQKINDQLAALELTKNL